MSKQRRGVQGQSKTGADSAESVSEDASREVVRGPERTPVFDPESALTRARDVAVPLLQHAQLALEVDADAGQRLPRNLQIVEQSGLPSEQRSQLSDRLIERATAASEISRAFVDSFGRDDDATRGSVSDTLETLQHLLSDGRDSDGALALSDGRRVEVSAERPAAPELIRQTASLVEGPQGGVAILAFCQRARLALMLEEEDEWAAALPAEQQE